MGLRGNRDRGPSSSIRRRSSRLRTSSDPNVVSLSSARSAASQLRCVRADSTALASSSARRRSRPERSLPPIPLRGSHRATFAGTRPALAPRCPTRFSRGARRAARRGRAIGARRTASVGLRVRAARLIGIAPPAGVAMTAVIALHASFTAATVALGTRAGNLHRDTAPGAGSAASMRRGSRRPDPPADAAPKRASLLSTTLVVPGCRDRPFGAPLRPPPSRP